MRRHDATLSREEVEEFEMAGDPFGYTLRPPKEFLTREQAHSMLVLKKRRSSLLVGGASARPFTAPIPGTEGVEGGGVLNLGQWKKSAEKNSNREKFFQNNKAAYAKNHAAKKDAVKEEEKWEQINQAGCIFWKNLATGECTSMAPATSFVIGKAMAKFSRMGSVKEKIDKRKAEEKRVADEWDREMKNSKRAEGQVRASLAAVGGGPRKKKDDAEIKHGTGALVYDSGDYDNLMTKLEESRPTTRQCVRVRILHPVDSHQHPHQHQLTPHHPPPSQVPKKMVMRRGEIEK